MVEVSVHWRVSSSEYQCRDLNTYNSVSGYTMVRRRVFVTLGSQVMLGDFPKQGVPRWASPNVGYSMPWLALDLRKYRS